ncbi:hypothetical protein QFC19_008176 [Naganishia cerealis]|uniref:Uncharacterized protein n=1 Tax=Naganishia cerealis TaxID=610337 RepID=A0ACC2V3N6_9TREE|nr:hypothetical protein QFC19_008176 [Naganishia cerealis]
MSLDVNTCPPSSSSVFKLILSRSPSSTADDNGVTPPTVPVLEMCNLQLRRRPTITQAEKAEATASAALGGQGMHTAEDEQESESGLFNADGSATKKQKHNAFKALLGAGVITLISVWASAVWLFGSLHNAEKRVHNMRVLVANYDDGLFGQALLLGVQSLGSGPTIPTFEITDMTMAEVKEKVWAGDVWGAIWANPGRSAAFNGSLIDTAAAESYSAADAYTYTGLQVRYFTVFQSYLYPVFLETVGIASGIITTAAAGLNLDRRTLSPAQLGMLGTDFDHRRTGTQFLMGQNGIFTGFGIHRSTSTLNLLKIKYPVKIGWTLIGGLSTASFAYIFAEGWHMPGKNLIALWALAWVFCLINYSTFAVLIAFVPIAFISCFVLPIVMISNPCSSFLVAATIFPIDVQNVFYRISYMFPSHAYWSAAMTIYGNGAYHKLHIYLPILAAWLVIGELAQCYSEYTLAKKSWKNDKEDAHH